MQGGGGREDLDPDSVITMMREKTVSNKFRKINLEIQMEKMCKIIAIVFCWATVQFIAIFINV